MIRSQTLRYAFLVFACGVVSMGFVCVPLDFMPDDQGPNDPDPAEAYTYEYFVGGNEKRLVFRQDYYEGTRYVVFDLISGAGTPLDVPYPTSDGTWLTYEDENYVLHALNLETGEDSELPPTGFFFSSRLVTDSRLYGPVSLGSQDFLMIYDLPMGNPRLLLENLQSTYGSFDADAEWIAIWFFPNTPKADEVATLELTDPAIQHLFSTSIDVINLNTNERRTVASALPPYTYVGPLKIMANQVFWNQSTYDPASESESSTVWAYDLTTQHSKQLMELPEGDAVRGIGPAGVLLHRWIEVGASGEYEDVVELHRFSGGVDELVRYPRWVEDIEFAGSLIVYADPSFESWIVYDPATGERRTIVPFGP